MGEQEPRRTVRVKLDISQETREAWSLMAQRHNLTMTEEFGQIVADRKYLEEQIANGDKVLLAHPDGTMSEVLFNSKQRVLGPDDRADYNKLGDR